MTGQFFTLSLYQQIKTNIMTAIENELQGALKRLNKNLEPSGRYMEMGGRNGYFTLDMYNIKKGNCIDLFASTDNRKQMLSLIYSLSRVIELVNNPI